MRESLWTIYVGPTQSLERQSPGKFDDILLLILHC